MTEFPAPEIRPGATGQASAASLNKAAIEVDRKYLQKVSTDALQDYRAKLCEEADKWQNALALVRDVLHQGRSNQNLLQELVNKDG